jgi:hypothetical protein
MKMKMNKAPASGSEPFSLVDGICPAATADRVSRPGARRVWTRGSRYHICNTQRHPALSTNDLQSWSQPECGQSLASSPRSAKGIGLSMRTHCQTAVPLSSIAPMRGEIAIPDPTPGPSPRTGASYSSNLKIAAFHFSIVRGCGG